MTLPYSALIGLLLIGVCGCSSTDSPKANVERGPNGTIAYYVEVEASVPGVKIEANGDFIGTTPCTLKIFGDKDGTFHNFGSYTYEVRALPTRPGEIVQVKTFRTGGWFTPEDRIPKRIFFEMSLVPSDSAGSRREQAHESPSSGAKVSGTGFFITDDGYMVSNYHVVEDAESVSVIVGGDALEAKVVEKDIQTDLVLLKVACKSKPLPLGDSRTVRVGERVFTLGFPNVDVQGAEVKFTEGTISSLTGIQDDATHFQIQVPVQPGNSGGPLIGEYGTAVGVVDSRLNEKPFSVSGRSLPQNVCYAIKGSRIMNLFDRFPEIAQRLPKGESQAPKPFADLNEMYRPSVVLIRVARR
jgi:S1-C subfamily serine protease